MIDGPEAGLRFQLWLHRAWPFRALAWVLSRRVSKSLGFGRFHANDFEPLTSAQHAVVAAAEPARRGRVIESLLPTDANPTKNPRKILFIDFDGVLHATSGTADAMRQFVWLPNLLATLEGHEVGIVVHASAREHSSEEFLRHRLGLPEALWRGTTSPNLGRWLSIRAWLEDHPETRSYRILDDQPGEFPPGLPELILCDGRKGVSAPSVQKKLKDWLREEKTGDIND